MSKSMAGSPSTGNFAYLTGQVNNCITGNPSNPIWTASSAGRSPAFAAGGRGYHLLFRASMEALIEGTEYWWEPGPGKPRPDSPSPRIHLLPGHDEFILGFKNRDAALDPAYAGRICPGGNGVFSPTIVIDGIVRGTWKRTILRKRVKVGLSPSLPFRGRN
ncbi:MAG: hypothetical protein A2001_19785 [Treponema sp. GWC1_61_84]|nr:MAG: hypothetical protein A2001_19785 [Treponema sp. GWC1_61_84]